MSLSRMASISERENREIRAANASGKTPVVFIHGLWLLPSSWANWADFFKQAGYAPLTPDWPDDPETVEEARAKPAVLAGKTLAQVADHTTEITKMPNRGHSLTIDDGWREVAQTALDFVKRFAPPGYSPGRSAGTAPASRERR